MTSKKSNRKPRKAMDANRKRPPSQGKKTQPPKAKPKQSKQPDAKLKICETPSRLLDINDRRAQREMRSIFDRLEAGGVSLEDSVSLMVRAAVDSSITPDMMQKAFRSACQDMTSYIEMLMTQQAMSHVAAEADMTRRLDMAAERLFSIIESEHTEPSNKVSAFNALVRWRKDRTEYPFLVAKLIQDTSLVDRVASIFQRFVEMGKSGDSQWEKLLEDIPAKERQDMALLVRWMTKAQGLDLETVQAKLEESLTVDAEIVMDDTDN